MKKAFTLIELLVVIAIIAVLTGIVMASFSQAKSKSRDAERISELAQIQLAIQLYFDRCGNYPDADGTSPNAKISLYSSQGCPNNVTLRTFMGQVPVPPNAADTSFNYRYIVQRTGNINSNYYLAVRLENQNSALADDIDGTVGGSSGWTGFSLTEGGAPQWSADDVTDNYIYAITSK